VFPCTFPIGHRSKWPRRVAVPPDGPVNRGLSELPPGSRGAAPRGPHVDASPGVSATARPLLRCVSDRCPPGVGDAALPRDGPRAQVVFRAPPDRHGPAPGYPDAGVPGQGVAGLWWPRFTVLYCRWLKHGDAAFEAISSPAIAEALSAGTARVECSVLSHFYRHLSALGESGPFSSAEG